MMTKDKFLGMLYRIMGHENLPFIKMICWFVSNMERKYWNKNLERFTDVWNVLYQAQLTMPSWEKGKLPSEIQLAIAII